MPDASAEHVKEGFPGQRLTVLPKNIQQRCRDLPVVQNLYVTDIGHFPSADHHYVERSDGVPETILIYCTDGSGWCDIGDERHTLSEGWTLLIPPHTAHIYSAAEDAPWSIYWTHFDGGQAEDYQTLLGASTHAPLLYVPDTQFVTQAFEEVYSYVQGGYTDDSLVGLSTAFARLLGLLRCRRRAPDVKGRRQEDKILQSIKYMREHLGEPCRLDDLADAAQMSTSHYSHLFKEQTNTSPVQFLIRLKMQRASDLLDTTDQTVQRIAGQVGYDDPFHFSRMFKKTIGKSPSAYRDATKG
jgi:AraC-like DNA-binding protein